MIIILISVIGLVIIGIIALIQHIKYSLIRRGDVRKLADWFETEDGEVLAVDIDDVDDIPAVPQEMTARELLLTEARMIYADEYAYAEYSRFIWNLKLDDAAAYAEQWASEHPEKPEKKRKTYAEDFKEHFGHSWNNKDNNWQCRGKLYNDNADCVNFPRCDCEACWNEEMEEQDE